MSRGQRTLPSTQKALPITHGKSQVLLSDLGIPPFVAQQIMEELNPHSCLLGFWQQKSSADYLNIHPAFLVGLADI